MILAAATRIDRTVPRLTAIATSPLAGRTNTLRKLVTAVTAAAAIAAAAALTACAGTPDPAAAKAALEDVTEPVPAEIEDLVVEAETEPIELSPIECTPVLVVTARGTGEPHRGQLLSPVAKGIAKALPDDVTVEDLDYPADTNVNAGATLGVRTLIEIVNLQAATCPEQRFVLMGYSQGAMVIGDALSAPADRLVGGTAPEIDADAAERVNAVVFYGNPRFAGAESFDFGSFSAERDGLLPRREGALAAFSERIRDFCVADDFICQARTSELDEMGHVEYFDNGMQQDGADFALEKLPKPKDYKSKKDSFKRGTSDSATDGSSDGSGDSDATKDGSDNHSKN